MYDLIKEHRPQVVVIDPITNFASIGTPAEIKSAITRIIDFLKNNNITALFTDATPERDHFTDSVVGISSLIDAWVSLRNIENNGVRHRGLYILKSRGMGHSNQIRSFHLTEQGIKIGEMETSGRRTNMSSLEG